MLRRILESTKGADIYAVAGLIFFFLSFTGLIIWIFRADKNYLKKMKNLPLEDETPEKKNSPGENNED